MNILGGIAACIRGPALSPGERVGVAEISPNLHISFLQITRGVGQTLAARVAIPGGVDPDQAVKKKTDVTV